MLSGPNFTDDEIRGECQRREPDARTDRDARREYQEERLDDGAVGDTTLKSTCNMNLSVHHCRAHLVSIQDSTSMIFIAASFGVVFRLRGTVEM